MSQHPPCLQARLYSIHELHLASLGAHAMARDHQQPGAQIPHGTDSRKGRVRVGIPSRVWFVGSSGGVLNLRRLVLRSPPHHARSASPCSLRLKIRGSCNCRSFHILPIRTARSNLSSWWHPLSSVDRSLRGDGASPRSAKRFQFRALTLALGSQTSLSSCCVGEMAHRGWRCCSHATVRSLFFAMPSPLAVANK